MDDLEPRAGMFYGSRTQQITALLLIASAILSGGNFVTPNARRVRI
jgi:hypothetical protein